MEAEAEKAAAEQEAAAIKMQSSIRGRLARQETTKMAAAKRRQQSKPKRPES